MFKICMEKIKIIGKGLIPLALISILHHSFFSKVIVTNKQTFSQQMQYISLEADVPTEVYSYFLKNRPIWV